MRPDYAFGLLGPGWKPLDEAELGPARLSSQWQTTIRPSAPLGYLGWAKRFSRMVARVGMGLASASAKAGWPRPHRGATKVGSVASRAASLERAPLGVQRCALKKARGMDSRHLREPWSTRQQQRGRRKRLGVTVQWRMQADVPWRMQVRKLRGGPKKQWEGRRIATLANAPVGRQTRQRTPWACRAASCCSAALLACSFDARHRLRQARQAHLPVLSLLCACGQQRIHGRKGGAPLVQAGLPGLGGCLRRVFVLSSIPNTSLARFPRCEHIPVGCFSCAAHSPPPLLLQYARTHCRLQTESSALSSHRQTTLSSHPSHGPVVAHGRLYKEHRCCGWWLRHPSDALLAPVPCARHTLAETQKMKKKTAQKKRPRCPSLAPRRGKGVSCPRMQAFCSTKTPSR